MAAETKMEFAVQMTCKSCEEAVRNALNVPGISGVYVDVSNELVLVDTTLPSSVVQSRLESTGKLVVFRGFGGAANSAPPTHHGAAVAAMSGRGGVSGLARMVQVSPEKCVIEGTVDGLEPERDHMIKIHEYGDLSKDCQNCGEVYGLIRNGTAASEQESPIGDLGVARADSNGRATFQMTSEQVKVWDVIGRSLVVHAPPTGATNRVLCGIIARSAGLFQNTKKVCTCDGVTLWEEAEKRSKPKS